MYRVGKAGLVTAALPWLMGTTLLSCLPDAPLITANLPGHFNPLPYSGPNNDGLTPICFTDPAGLTNSVRLGEVQVGFAAGTVPSGLFRDARDDVGTTPMAPVWFVPMWSAYPIPTTLRTASSAIGGQRRLWFEVREQRGDCRPAPQNTGICQYINIIAEDYAGQTYQVTSGWRQGTTRCQNNWRGQRLQCRWPPPPPEGCWLPSDLPAGEAVWAP